MGAEGLEGVRFRRHWLSLAGALGGLLEAAGRNLEQWYLMGATGHAFRLTLDLVISPSSPMELNFHDVFPLWENLGAWFKRTAALASDPRFADVRAEALERVSSSLERGRPVIAFDLMGMPEYGLVVGFDSERLACLTLNNDVSPEWMDVAAWPAVAERHWTRVDVIELLDLASEFDQRRAEVASLKFAVDHFWSPPSRDQWLQHGQKAYEFWISVLTSPLPLHGGNPGLGQSYNFTVAQRARRDAAAYVWHLAGKYPAAKSLEVAARHYGEVAATLAEATRILPFPGTDGLERVETRQELAGCLRRALAVERMAVDEIEKALRALR